MSQFINVGALIDGRDAPSKRALKLTLADKPERVTFYTTSELSPRASYTGDQVPDGAKLSVVGPNPYSARRYYATVEVGPKGVKLS